MLPANLSSIIDQVGKDKGLDKDVLVEAIEAALITAARRKLGATREIEAHFNTDTGEIELHEFKTVVEDVTDPASQVSLAEARELDPESQIGDTLGYQVKSEDLGRIAAQTAKQVIIQRMREAEREMVYDEYHDRSGELVTGIARRFEKGNIIVDLGRAEAILPYREMGPRDNYRPGDRVQALLLEVDRERRGPLIVLSRANPQLVVRLFEQEVPEIAEGIVRIEAVAREPGSRTKIAVSSRDSDVDPVGACVGVKGSRVQNVVQELRSEKIDIVPYSPEPARFVCNALAPAEVSRVLIDETNNLMEVIVPDDQLSLAIGRKGQNVRLAHQLSGWKLDIISESRVAEIRARAMTSLAFLDGANETVTALLYEAGFRGTEDVASASLDELLDVPGLSPETAARLLNSAPKAVEAEKEWLKTAEAEAAAAVAAGADGNTASGEAPADDHSGITAAE
jgi:transcription termination/antitermination protein NusA